MVLASAVVLLVLVSAFGFYELTQAATLKEQSSSLSSEVVSLEVNNMTSVSQAFYSHLFKIESGNVNASLDDYAANSTVIWSGTTQGLGGTYTGTQSIKQLLQTWLGDTKNFTLSVGSFNETSVSYAISKVNASLSFSGHSNIMGNFNGTVSASYVFAFRGSWLISQETWLFKSFDVQFSHSDTTFPQWQATSGGIPLRFSESPFKNWVYYYGGLAAAVLLTAYLATIPLLLYVRKKWPER